MLWFAGCWAGWAARSCGSPPRYHGIIFMRQHVNRNEVIFTTKFYKLNFLNGSEGAHNT